MKIKPLLNNVVIKDLATKQKIQNGIVLPSSAQEKPQLAKVVAVGLGEWANGKRVTMEVKKGDTVLYSKFAGSTFKLENEEYKILNENDIIAIIEE